MSDKPQQESDVSRETSVDMLNDIMDRTTPHGPNLTDETTQPDASTQKQDAPTQTEKKAPNPPVEKNKRSSVYVYLAVLFGAAFLMLLLAYFVQQRNNATVLDDLRSTTASREELLEDIQRLEEENQSLQKDNELLNIQLDQIKEERESLKSQLDEYYYSTAENYTRIALNNELDYLERFIASKDWLMAGIIIETSDHLYNEHNVEYTDTRIKPTPSQTARYFELKEEVFRKGGIMVVEQFSATEDWSEYTERPYIGKNIFNETDYDTAKSLLSSILYYPDSLDLTAKFLFEHFRVTDSSLERLNSEAFKPSTVELYQQIRADILASGKLIEQNGELKGAPSDTDSAQSENNG